MIAKLQIETAWKNKSFLKHSYFTPPFKVADITEDKTAGILQLMLMNASPGILDRDDYTIQLKVGENSSLHLHTQSYQRLFTMKTNAVQSMTVQVEKNASFIFLPHPTVPYKDADFRTINTIFLSEGSELLWYDILTCGRKGCGEVFSFSTYHNLTKIFYNGKLVVKENVLIRPAIMKLNNAGQWEGFTHQASLIYWNEKIHTASFITGLYDLLKDTPGLCLGISALPVNGLLIRLLGNSAEQLFDLFKNVASFICQQKLLNSKMKTETVKAASHA